MGVGIGPEVYKQCPGVPSRMWAELDIVPWVLQIGIDLDTDEMKEIHGEEGWAVDEKADSLVRKCILLVTRTHQAEPHADCITGCSVQPSSPD